VNGPPQEIESHPSSFREVWRFLDGREFEFNGERYELTAERPAEGRAPGLRVMERISVERLVEPQRRYLRERLARFVGQPMSNDLMIQIRAAAADIDQTLTYKWSIDRVTGNGALELSQDGTPGAAK
jgi:hypothetical protein